MQINNKQKVKEDMDLQQSPYDFLLLENNKPDYSSPEYAFLM